MSLRLQLLAFGLLTLLLPWAGLRFVEQMEGVLRQGLESSLLASAGTVATAIANEPVLSFGPSSGDAPVIYGQQLVTAPRIDGYRADWTPVREQFPTGGNTAIELDATTRFWIGVAGRFAYLYVEVDRDEIVYPATPGAGPFGDRVAILYGGGAGGTGALLLSTTAPGQFRAQGTTRGRYIPSGDYEDRVMAAWEESGAGFSVEARIPLNLLAGEIGVAVIDVDPQNRSDSSQGAAGFSVDMISSWGTGPARAAVLIHELEGLRSVLNRLSRTGDRYRVVDANGWVLADSGAVNSSLPTANADASLSERFFRFVLRRNDPPYDGLEQPRGRVGDPKLRRVLDGDSATAWYRQGPESSAVVAAAVPIVSSGKGVGAVVLEQSSDSVLTLTNQALLRLMSFTILVSVIAATGLFAYASFLSFRIRRLAGAAETALSPAGEIDTALPGGSARDEVGDLSRSFAALLGRLSAYTDYLRTLTGKLAHEIRTPIAIISTSLDNLEHETNAAEARKYVERMRVGTARLDAILGAMSAATHVEQSVSESPAEYYDLAEVVEACAAAYRDVYADRNFLIQRPKTPCPVFGSGDLLAQLVDKLVENAVSFSEPGGSIELGVAAAGDLFELSVANQGPLLPEAMRHQVFDSLVSVRERRDAGTHLGLGLYIVALIAKYHGGTVEAGNLADSSGVILKVRIPCRTATGDSK
jgi:two-component system sensor histidine kinase ChvG